MTRKRKLRKTRFGRPVAQPVTPVTEPDNLTPYGGMRLRKPIRAGEFVGSKGSPIMAGILDIDGTLQDFGSSASKRVLDWMTKVEKKYPDMVWLVVTARTHEYDYTRSFNWLVKHVPHVFVGPFCRAENDPRYASEFKREIAEGFENMGLYRIVAAADDNKYVIDMWKFWQQTRSADLDLLECSYSSYATWRKDLPSKGYSTPAKATTTYGTTPWTRSTPANRPAGTSRWDDYDAWEADEKADEAVQGALAALEAKDPSLSRFEDRLDLEDDVWAAHPELTMHEIQGMDTEVLEQMLATANEPKKSKK